MDGWIDEWMMDGCMNKWMDVWMDGWINPTSFLVHPQLHYTFYQKTMGHAILQVSILNWKQF